MREGLEKFLGKRRVFQGEFCRFGTKSGWKGRPVRTILLLHVVDVASKIEVADHLWFTCGKRFDCLDLKEGDLVRFHARVTSYLKGYLGYRDEEGFQTLDYRLSFPTKVEKVNRYYRGALDLLSLSE